jgi:hypothetical protein
VEVRNNVLGPLFICLGVVNVNSDRLEQDCGVWNLDSVAGVPGVIVSGPIFNIANWPDNAMRTIGGHDTEISAGLDEQDELKLKLCERQV